MQGGFHDGGGYSAGFIYICSFCGEPTYLGSQGTEANPGCLPGEAIEALPEDVERLYEEARRCLASGAPTAAAMACRKILMNSAVSPGAEENQPFAHYVNWMDENGYIPPNGKAWVDQIRGAGNAANHEIPHIETDLATRVFSFTAGLLRFAYEFPAQAGEDVS
jgi:uncharacterized protein DUF4145